MFAGNAEISVRGTIICFGGCWEGESGVRWGKVRFCLFLVTGMLLPSGGLWFF